LKWLANFNQTRWLDQIASLLQEASALITRMSNEQTLMITIIADSDIRGAQLTALAQVLLFPEYRTLVGFS
jgi:Myotubularin-like phosphatase domain